VVSSFLISQEPGMWKQPNSVRSVEKDCGLEEMNTGMVKPSHTNVTQKET